MYEYHFCPVCGGILNFNEPILMGGAYLCRYHPVVFPLYNDPVVPTDMQEDLRQLTGDLRRALDLIISLCETLLGEPANVQEKPNDPLVEDENAASGPASDTPGTPAGDA